MHVGPRNEASHPEVNKGSLDGGFDVLHNQVPNELAKAKKEDDPSSRAKREPRQQNLNRLVLASLPQCPAQTTWRCQPLFEPRM